MQLGTYAECFGGSNQGHLAYQLKRNKSSIICMLIKLGKDFVEFSMFISLAYIRTC